MITEWYTVGNSDEKLEYHVALDVCRKQGINSEKMVYLYRHTDYSDDDPTPLPARTYFNREFGCSMYHVSHDGR